jgi:hypothetical protein
LQTKKNKKKKIGFLKKKKKKKKKSSKSGEFGPFFHEKSIVWVEITLFISKFCEIPRTPPHPP